MAFQRSYSKVWWGSDNQLSTAGSSFTSGGYYYQGQTAAAIQSQQQQHNHHHQPFGGSGYHSLDYNSMRMFSGNLSRIQEVEDDEQQQHQQQNMSKLSWEKHDSPGSLRSQDSGFSDNDETHSTRQLSGCSSKTASPSNKSDISRKSSNAESPASIRTIATPPTVIRRVGRSEFYSPLVSVSRRISFSGSPGTLAATGKEENVKMKNVAGNNAIDDDEADDIDVEDTNHLLAQLDSIQLLNSTPKHADNADDVDDAAPVKNAEKIKVKSKTKRRKRIVRTPTKPLKTPLKRRTLPQNGEQYSSDDDDNNNEAKGGATAENSGDDRGDVGSSSFDELEEEMAELRAAKHTVPPYNNETIYLGSGVAPVPYNNETVILGGALSEDTNNNTLKLVDETSSTYHKQQRTSTPKAVKQRHLFVNPLLNGHMPSLQNWLHELRSSYDQEVMSTLQTKSIAQEAFKNLTITTNTVAKLIRQLQQRALYLQSDFERIERILSCTEPASLHDALSSAAHLVSNIVEFTRVLERRAVFFSDSRIERKRYEDNLDQIKIITKDTRYSLERQHYINLESLLDDVQVLKRYLLIALRQVFERMVRVIVHSIEQGRCDLMLRANINMVATLTNIDYEGFASLTDAFVQNEAVRALLIVCLEHKLSSVRALALRALATICCAPAAIAQLGACDGIEILRDILQVQSSESCRRSDMEVKRGATERREAVSLLTQITAAWHGSEHRVAGLKDCVETIVAGLTQLVIEQISCSQTLLLCAAALNNLSRMEVTSHYSIMSNETIFKLIETVEAKQQEHKLKDECGVSIFFYEQIVAMLHNMSLNKKCHSHLANGCIINFITSTYEMEFYKRYDSRAESDAQRRTIKAILHTLTRLIHDSNGGSLGLELLQQQRIPAVFFNLAKNVSDNASGEYTQSPYAGCQHLSRDIELLVRQLELAQQQQSQQRMFNGGGNVNVGIDSSKNMLDTQQELSPLPNGKVINAETNSKFNLTRHESFV